MASEQFSRPHPILIGMLAGLLLLLGTAIGLRLQKPQTPVAASPSPAAVSTPSLVVSAPADFVGVVEKVLPSVVSINAVKVIPGYRHPWADDPRFQYRFGPDLFSAPDQKVQSAGTGVIVGDNKIITNNHVVQGMQEISVTLSDGRVLPARLRGTDPATDLALLETDTIGFPPVVWGSSESMRVGEWVLAFGSPFSLSSSVSHGIISAKGRKGLGIADYENFLQTDASINPGNSGGPLVNLKGEVVGINTAILSHSGGSQGVGLAVPSEAVREVMVALEKEGHINRGWMGLFLQEIDPQVAQKLGYDGREALLVVGGYRNGPGARAGLQLYDVITSVNGEPTPNQGVLRNRMAESRPGDTMKLGIWRQGRELEADVPVTARPLDPEGRPAQGI